MEAKRITHRERLETCLSGGIPDRTPVALWRHFPVDDQSAEGLAAACLHFQRTYDFDLVKVTPASSFSVRDWGVLDEWRGSSEGTRDYIDTVINTPSDWESLQVLDPGKGYLGEMLTCLDLLVKELGPDTPVLQTVFNPLSVAKHLAGNARLLVHMRQYPEAVHAGLRTITESIQLFIEAASKRGIAGIFYAVQHAQFGLLTEAEYRVFGQEYDLLTLEPAQELWLNMLHMHGADIMFNLLSNYPVQVINWHDQDTPPSLAEGLACFPGVVCGGLERVKSMVLGTPEMVDFQASKAIEVSGGRRFILGTGCVLPITAPHGNITAARHSVE